ncbi:MAG: hypothetical protein WCL28_08175 [bacterium]
MIYSGSRFIFEVILLFVAATTGAHAANSVRKNDQPTKYKTEEFIIDNFRIDGAFPAMTGPTKKKYVTLSTNPKARYIWVKGVGVDVFSDKKKNEPLSLLCHAWITLGDKNTYASGTEGLLTISEGMGESLFPAGYGMYLENKPNNDVELLAQVLNDNPHFKRDLGYRFKITYLEDYSSKPSLLKPLKQTSFSAVGPAVAFKDGEMCQADGAAQNGQSVHFVVPPGRHKFSRIYPKGTFSENTSIHFIKVHLHQYGQNISLIDKTANKVLWTGQAMYSKEHIDSVDFYSNSEGIKVFADHEYEVTSEYWNKTAKIVDGMAVLRMYRATKEAI